MSIFKNDYEMTVWPDHIVDVITEELIQEGTRFTASRASSDSNIGVPLVVGDKFIYTGRNNVFKFDKQSLDLITQTDIVDIGTIHILL